MRIAMVGGRGLPATYSGIEALLKGLGPRLVARGHEVTVYCRPAYFSSEMYDGVRLVRVPSIGTKRLDTLTHAAAASVRAVRDKASVIHYHAIGPAALSPIARALRVPSVATIHSLNWQQAKWNAVDRAAIRTLERWAVRGPDRVVAVAKRHQIYLQQTYGKEVLCIPNAVDVVPRVEAGRILELGVAPDAYALYVGRLSPEKGCHYLVDAVRNWNGPWKLAIAGDVSGGGPYVTAIRRKASERIVFLGHVSGDLLAELYCNAALYVLPSDAEALSMSLLEAMSYGCCVVASGIEENRDVLADCGFYFDAGDVEGLGRMLTRLMGDRGVRTEVGARARLRAHALFQWDRTCDEYEKLYASLV